MSWNDPARVEKLEALLYKCRSTFATMLDHPADLLDRKHVEYALDMLVTEMAELDLPDYNKWKWSAGKGHLDWVCHDVSKTFGRWTCSKCGRSVSIALTDEQPRYCAGCGRKVVGE